MSDAEFNKAGLRAKRRLASEIAKAEAKRDTRLAKATADFGAAKRSALARYEGAGAEALDALTARGGKLVSYRATAQNCPFFRR